MLNPRDEINARFQLESMELVDKYKDKMSDHTLYSNLSGALLATIVEEEDDEVGALIVYRNVLKASMEMANEKIRSIIANRLR